MTDTLILSSSDISALVRRVGIDPLMDELIDRFEDACRAYHPEHCQIPPRTGFHYHSPHPGLVEWMPLMMHGDRILMKMVGYHPDNPPLHNLPTILCTLALFDAATGHVIALVDGTFLTVLRTGAASAVASRLLAAPESRTLGLIGAGAQAVSQLHAISRVFPLERVLVHDIDPARVATFPDRVAPLALSDVVIEAAPVDTLVGESDIVSTATSIAPGAGPVFSPDHPTKPWLHVNAVGSDFPGKLEVPLEFLERSFVCPDFREQVEREGECQQLDHSQIGPELLDVAKRPDDFAAQRSGLTLFDSTGFALEDHVALALLLEHAGTHRLGTRLPFENITPDPYHPYQFLERAGVRDATDSSPEERPSTPAVS